MKYYLSSIIILFSVNATADTSPVIIIDGNISDWTLPLKYYDSETKLSYSITNDDSAFYFCIRATEKNMQIRITRVGFQISLDPKGKKNQKFNLVYKPELPMPLRSGFAEKSSPEEMKLEFNQKLMLVSLSGFPGITDDTYFTYNLKGIQFAMDWDSMYTLNIEYKIPFSIIGYNTSEQEFSLGIILFAMGMPSGEMRPPGNMRDGSSAEIAKPSGMSPPQGDRTPPPRLNDRNDMFSEKKVWTKFKALILK